MNTQLDELNKKGIFSVEIAMLELRLRVKLLHEFDSNQLVIYSRKLKKLTASYGLSPNFTKGFWVKNDSISIQILHEISDELSKFLPRK